jgi:hypothetical protein
MKIQTTSSPTYAQSNGISEKAIQKTNPRESQGSIYWSDGVLPHASYWNDMFTIATADGPHEKNKDSGFQIFTAATNSNQHTTPTRTTTARASIRPKKWWGGP